MEDTDARGLDIVILDACVLIPSLLVDTLLRCAEASLYRVRFSHKILDEFERNFAEILAARSGIPAEAAAQRAAGKREAIERAFRFDEALVTGFEPLEGHMLNDPEDRHVTAAAVRGQANVIVTANLRDFRPEHLAAFGLTAKHPDQFLTELLEKHPVEIANVLRQQSAAYRRREIPLSDLLAYLASSVPEFARRAKELLIE